MWCVILFKKKESDNVAKKEITNIMSNCNKKNPTDIELIESFKVMKLKNNTPKISDKLLS
ncbi:hypothetical protein D3C80_1132770 [compost metagenome]